MVNGQQQRYDSQAPIVVSKAGRTVVDLTETYRGQLSRARRGLALRADGTVVVQDEFTAAGAEARVRWAMVTRAEVRAEGPGRAVLEREGKRMELRAVEPAGVEWKVYSTEPPAATDAPNPGTRMVGFEVTLAAGAAGRIVVEMRAGGAGKGGGEVVGLGEW